MLHNTAYLQILGDVIFVVLWSISQMQNVIGKTLACIIRRLILAS